MCLECDEITRRSFLISTAAAVTGVGLGANAVAQESLKMNALDDPKLTYADVSFKNGADTIKGHLVRPKTKRRHRAIIILHGDPGLPAWVRNTAARLAQVGYVGLVIDLGSRNEAPPPREIDPREFYLGNTFDKRVSQDVIASIEYLKQQSFVKSDGVGMVGFCFGGRRALMLPTESKDVKAGVSFYGPVRERGYRSKSDPRPDVMEIANQIKVPVQGHYGTLDTVAQVADAKEFENKLKAQGAPVEMFYYEGAGHGFYGNTWQEQTPEFGYNAEAAELAHKRMVEFLLRKLK